MWSVLASTLLAAGTANAQVTASGPNGATNPSAPGFYPIGSQVNMTSFSRLLTLNGVDDFCLYGPPEPGPDSVIGNVEPIVVSWCTKPRNGARLIPDGAIHAAHLIKTDMYVQIYGFWDGTQVNIPYGDSGGELDPHGEKDLGNPIGGNVTTNLATGQDVFYQEWMSFVSFDQFCLRICTAQNATISTGIMCEHKLDIMGCRFVMAIEDFYKSNGTFTSCDGEVAAPPGHYPIAGGGTSTFAQRYTGTWTADGVLGTFTVGQTVTPEAPAFWPKTSNCVTYSTISNGVATTDYMVKAAPTVFLHSQSGSTVIAVPTTTQADVTSGKAPAATPTAADGNSTNGGAAGGNGANGGGNGGASGSNAAGASGGDASTSAKGNGAQSLIGNAGLAVTAVSLIGSLLGAVYVL